VVTSFARNRNRAQRANPPFVESLIMLATLASVAIASRHPALRTLSRAATVASLVAVSLGSIACDDGGTSPRSPRLVYGAAQALGQGTARTFVTLDNAGKPASLGVAISESAMGTLPQQPHPGMPAAAMLTLALPAEAAVTGYDHVMLDWNPAGHEPQHVYTHPHFDFHFFQITPAQRDQLHPGNPDFGPKSGIFPTAEYVPTGFVAGSVLANVPPAAAAVPLMGMHWLDTSSPELQPPPNGKTFTSTFIYGSYNGTFIFVEPMITKAHIETTKNRPEGYRYTLPMPARVARTGSYPGAYAITWNAAAREYRISLESLVTKQAQ
jgi:Domain of unknown function (DUF5602)